VAVAFTGPAARAQQAAPTARVDSCTTSGCHTDVIDRPMMHLPVSELKCFECHTYANAEQHRFDLTKPAAQLCLDCHTVSHGDRVIHQPVADGDCLSCHDPHGSEHKTILRKDPTKGLCLDCHQEDYTAFEFVHGPVAVGACTVCHDSHSSSYPKLLTESPTRLCGECHEGKVPTGTRLWQQHKPMEQGCTSCHNPHASDSPFQLASTTTNVCLSCHEGMRETLGSAHTVHGPLTEANGCVQCHDPHFSPFEHLQKAEQPELCMTCHDKPVTTASGRVLADMRALLLENPDHHGPIRQGACTMCHQPHASAASMLLTQAYPPEFYAPFAIENYQLCFTCHEADLVRDESGTRLTGFRDEDLNLHWLHVNQEKGRTCRACHEVHASKNPFHIRDAVPFGPKEWMLEINFQILPEGGTCAPACHVERAYSRIAALAEPAAPPTPAPPSPAGPAASP